MSNPYIGEIRIFAGNFPPAGWEFCDGQILPISENDALFILIGTTYGGDGQSTFALPDLRGRLPIHQGSDGLGNTYILAETGGVEQVTLTTNQIPAHTHPFPASKDLASSPDPLNAVTAQSRVAGKDLYLEETPPNVNMDAGAITPAGGSQPHDNHQPYLGINFIISLYGIFPHQ
jgi:microcystin-dependent protein